MNVDDKDAIIKALDAKVESLQRMVDYYSGHKGGITPFEYYSANNLTGFQLQVIAFATHYPHNNRGAITDLDLIIDLCEREKENVHAANRAAEKIRQESCGAEQAEAPGATELPNRGVSGSWRDHIDSFPPRDETTGQSEAHT